MVTNDKIKQTMRLGDGVSAARPSKRIKALAEIRRMIADLQRAIQRYLVEYQPYAKQDVKSLGYSLRPFWED